VLRSGRVVSPAAAVARAKAALEAAYAAEEEYLYRGVGGYRLLRLSAATDRAILALERAERALKLATRRQ
jgi:hypothetical protein